MVEPGLYSHLRTALSLNDSDREAPVGERQIACPVAIEVYITTSVKHARPSARTTHAVCYRDRRTLVEHIEIEGAGLPQLLVTQVVAGRQQWLRKEL